MEKKPQLHNYFSKAALVIHIATSIVGCFGLFLDAVQTHNISNIIIYDNCIAMGLIVISNLLLYTKVIKIPTSFAIVAYSLVVNVFFGFFVVPYSTIIITIFLRDSFFVVFLMILSYLIVNKYNGLIITFLHLLSFIYVSLSTEDSFLLDSAVLFIVILLSFSSVMYYIITQFENLLYEQYTKSNIIKKQNIEANETNALLEERQKLIEDQSTELYRQKQELAKINNELKGLIATKDKFFSIIAHDLKNPISALMSFSELLYMRSRDFSEEKRNKIMGMVYQSSVNTYNLLENLLIWSRMQTSGLKENPKKIKICNLVEDVIKLVEGSYKKKEIKLMVDTDSNTKVIADQYMLTSVFHNLLTNAAKFTPKDGKVTVYTKQTEDQFLEICIADNGIGISKENMSKLFRIDQSFSTDGTNEEKGSGLGLILCKEFVERNKGKLWVESEVGKGSKFYFTIPLAN